jgi:hypothetical protein
MSKQDRRDLPELALQAVSSGAEGRRAQVEVLRDAAGQARGWRVRLDNGTGAELEDEAPQRLH